MNQRARWVWLLLFVCVQGYFVEAQNHLSLHSTHSRNQVSYFSAAYNDFHKFLQTIASKPEFSLDVGADTYEVVVDESFQSQIPYFTWKEDTLTFDAVLNFQMQIGTTPDRAKIMLVENEEKLVIAINENNQTRNLIVESILEDRVFFRESITTGTAHNYICDHQSEPYANHLSREKEEQQGGCLANDVAIIIDQAYYQMHGGASESQIFSIAHTMMGMYANETDVRMNLAALIGFPQGDPYVIKEDANGHIDPAELLQTFKDWSIYLDYDVKALLSGFDFGGLIIGKAFVGTSCDSLRNACIVQGREFDLTFNASILAHEIGHIYGLRHDLGTESGAVRVRAG